MNYVHDKLLDTLTIKFNDNEIAIIELSTIDFKKLITAVVSNTKGEITEINDVKYVKVLKSEADRVLSEYLKKNKIDYSKAEIYQIMKQRELIYCNNGKERIEYKYNETFIAFRSC